MTSMLGIRVLNTALINMVFFVLFTLSSGNAQPVDNDYFAVDRDGSLLHIVEYYHLGHSNFWQRFNSGHFGHALDDLKYVLRYFPNHPKALMLLGTVARLTKSPSLPMQYYERAIRLFPQYALTHAQFGDYLVDIGDFEVGLQKLKEAIEMDSKLALAHAYLAKAHYKTGNPELARRAAEKARKLGYGGKIPGEFKKNHPK